MENQIQQPQQRNTPRDSNPVLLSEALGKLPEINGAPKRATVECVECGKDTGSLRFYCDECDKKRDDAMREQIRAQREADRVIALEKHWQEFCPPLYRNFDIEKYPKESRTKLQQVIDWEYNSENPKGLILHGTTRKGKTMAMFRLMDKLIHSGRYGIFFPAVEFGIACSNSFSKGESDLFLRKCSIEKILFIDDLGNNKITDRVGEMLFGIIENRSSHFLPTFITSNYVGSSFAARLEGDRGDAFVARLREFCDSISF